MTEKKNEDEDDTITCSKCGTTFENTADIRRIANKLDKKGKPFTCPDCLAEAEAEREEAEAEEEEAEEEAEEEQEEAEEEEAPPAKPQNKKPKK
ncbi:Uncharacterised protein [uncultured archaeon]|nr:Uncharacterised protein [uncultured archaeon]